jgi:TRAP-type mannitol/chloroaromatic compound transport system substrate-binding protein
MSDTPSSHTPPSSTKAPDVTLKIQAVWSEDSVLHEFAMDYVNIVNTIGAGRVRLEMLPRGAVVSRGGDLYGAVASGALDAAHGVASNQYGKDKAYALFTTPPSFGWNSTQMLGWMRHGGGQALYDELVQTVHGHNISGYLVGPMPTQPLGWFKKPIHSPEDLKGLRFRTGGLSADVCRVMGMEPVLIPGNETAEALASGRVDAAEYLNPTIDRQVGLAKAAPLYIVQGYHQVCECFEIIFNKSRLDALGDEVKRILEIAGDAASSSMAYKQMVYYPRDLEQLKVVDNITVMQAPESVLDAQLAAWAIVIEDLSADPFFKRVIDSQRAWTKTVVGFDLVWDAPRERAFDFFNNP